jgi:hypothetical protein
MFLLYFIKTIILEKFKTPLFFFWRLLSTLLFSLVHKLSNKCVCSPEGRQKPPLPTLVFHLVLMD